MVAVSNLPTRDSPLDRPQRLGVLPTLSFWNDLRRQRLMRPFFLLAMLPLLPLFILLKLLHVSEWISSVAGIVLYPILLMILAAVVATLILFDVGARAILVVLSAGGVVAVAVVVLQARRVAHQIVERTSRALPEDREP